jgi:hypothetical protein
LVGREHAAGNGAMAMRSQGLAWARLAGMTAATCGLCLGSADEGAPRKDQFRRTSNQNQGQDLMPAIKVPAKKRNERRTTPTRIRHALGRAFLETLEKDFWEHGPQLIVKLRSKRPQDYLKLIVALLPEELLIEKTIEDMTDEELEIAVDALRPIVTAKLAAARREGRAAKD